MINIIVNGEGECLETPTELLDYFASREVKQQMVAVGYNGVVVHRDQWGKIVLHDGDNIDIVHMVGGG